MSNEQSSPSPEKKTAGELAAEMDNASRSPRGSLSEALKNANLDISRLKLDLNTISEFQSRLVAPKIPKIDLRNPLIESVNGNLASAFHEHLRKRIEAFDRELDAAFEVGLRLVSFGQSVTFHLHDMGFANPSLITFKGKTEEGDPVELIQHVSQISVLLMKMKRADPEKPKRPIGFQSECTDGD